MMLVKWQTTFSYLARPLLEESLSFLLPLHISVEEVMSFYNVIDCGVAEEVHNHKQSRKMLFGKQSQCNMFKIANVISECSFLEFLFFSLLSW